MCLLCPSSLERVRPLGIRVRGDPFCCIGNMLPAHGSFGKHRAGVLSCRTWCTLNFDEGILKTSIGDHNAGTAPAVIRVAVPPLVGE